MNVHTAFTNFCTCLWTLLTMIYVLPGTNYDEGTGTSFNIFS